MGVSGLRNLTRDWFEERRDGGESPAYETFKSFAITSYPYSPLSYFPDAAQLHATILETVSSI